MSKNIFDKLKALMMLGDLLSGTSSEESKPEFDDTPKEVGDKVRLIEVASLNYLHDYDAKKQLTIGLELASKEHMHLFENDAIVARVGVNYEYNCGHCSHIHKHDMIIMYPHNKKKYYASERDFRIVPTV